MGTKSKNKDMNKLAPLIAVDLGKGENPKELANKYDVDLSVVMHVKKTRAGYINKMLQINNAKKPVVEEKNEVVVAVEQPKVIEAKVDLPKPSRDRKLEIQLREQECPVCHTKIDENTNTCHCGYLKIDTATPISDLRRDYEAGEISIKLLMEKYGFKSYSGIYKALANEYPDGKIPYRVSSRAHANNTKEEEKTTGRKKGATKKTYRSLNKHQQKKIVQASSEKAIKAAEKAIEESNLVVNDSPIVEFDGIKFESNLINKLDKDSHTVEAGLFDNRHNMPTYLNLFVYKDSLDQSRMADYDYMDDVATGFINANVKPGNMLVLFCTGFQPALVAVIKACHKAHINLICKHYDPNIDRYLSQVAIDQYADIKEQTYPFTKLRGSHYTYDCTLDDIKNTGFTYAISINRHGENSTILASTYILTTDEDKAWDVFKALVKNMRTTETTTNNSILFGSMAVTSDAFSWRDNISKAFNYK